METNAVLTGYVQSYNYEGTYNYSLPVEWALRLMESGKETQKLLMLASFSEPIDAYEIKPCIREALKEAGLPELEGEEAVTAVIRYHLSEIANGNPAGPAMRAVEQLHFENNMRKDLIVFYSLINEWDDIKTSGVSYNPNITSLDDIETLLTKEAKQWLETY